MKPCPSCEATLATNALACPHCGHQFPKPGSVNLNKPTHVIALIGCAFFLLTVIFVVYSTSVAAR